MFNEFEITGRARTHIIQVSEPRFAAHPAAADAFLQLKSAASKEGFDLVPFSTFRDYKTQLRIWNHKYSGKKPLYDITGKVRDYASLDEHEIIKHILNWSALPGGSRHQWGTEIDVIDKSVMPEGYSPKLLPEETEEGGLFYPLHRWLDQNIEHYGFFRPYASFRGGMYPEPWHLSFASVSIKAIEYVNIELLMAVTKEADIMGKERVLEMIPDIYENHILNIVPPEEKTV